MAQRTCSTCGADISHLHHNRLRCSDACKPECVVDGCSRQAKSSTYCRTHLSRLASNGTLSARPYSPLPAQCVIDGCDKLPVARGWCSRHHSQWFKKGDPEYVHPAREPAKCGVADCLRTSKKRGWCELHYLRWRSTGDPAGNGNPPIQRATVFPDGSRKCTRCSIVKPAESFGVSSGKVRATCYPCGAEMRRESRLANPESERAVRDRANGMRRAAKLDAKADRGISVPVLKGIHGTACIYCGIEMDFSPQPVGQRSRTMASIEHIIPLSRGGSHTWENVTLACLGCNMSKNSSDAQDWLARRRSINAPSSRRALDNRN